MYVNGDITGWTYWIKPELDKAKFWHWMWQETGKPQSGAAYEVMKRTNTNTIMRCVAVKETNL